MSAPNNSPYCHALLELQWVVVDDDAPRHDLQEGLHFKRGRLPSSPLRRRVDLIDQLIQERSSNRASSKPEPDANYLCR